MNVALRSSRATSAYEKNKMLSDRDLFVNAAQSLRVAMDSGEETRMRRLAGAVNKNSLLWTHMESVVLADDSLSDETKAGIVSICRFVSRHSKKVLSGTADAAVLIDINHEFANRSI